MMQGHSASESVKHHIEPIGTAEYNRLSHYWERMHLELESLLGRNTHMNRIEPLIIEARRQSNAYYHLNITDIPRGPLIVMYEHQLYSCYNCGVNKRWIKFQEVRYFIQKSGLK